MEKFIQFLTKAPTNFHAVEQIAAKLAEADFTPLKEHEEWKLEAGKGYFVIRDDSLIAAWRMPKKKAEKAIILSSHVDSPALKLKPKPETMNDNISSLTTEIYGGPILHTWFDRDLAIAGRILVENKKGQIESQTVFLDDYPVIIPSVAIHLNREVNEKGPQINKQEHLRAVTSLKGKETLESILKKHNTFDHILSYDLFLVPLEKPAYVGFHEEFLSAYRLDNLTSAFASLEALLSAKASNAIQLAFFWDHEEIGSQTYTGADSVFASELLERISPKSYLIKSQSLNISVDVAHAFHPNFSDKNEPQNSPRIGDGPAIKFSSRYATNASTAAPLLSLAKRKKIAHQTAASRSDLSSGSTVGSMMGAQLGIPTVDIGMSCWAMHSTRETIAVADQKALTALLKASLEEL